MKFINYLEVKDSDLKVHTIQGKVDAANEGDFNDYQFNHIFGNKLRINIPLGKGTIPLSDKNVKEILEKEGYSVDFESGEATKTIKTQQGEKTQSFKLGRLFKRLSKSGPPWAEILHWWEMRNDSTKEMGDASGVSIIISRSPIDIIRMSDHKEWRSCHAPPGKPGHTNYWACAGQEARTGGPIAYVVRNKDLADVDLQAPEIFEDRDRQVHGVEPLERLRIRRFTTYNYQGHKELDFLVPEDSVYGVRHVGFAESVEKWAKQVQKEFIDFNNPPDWDNSDLRGGTYQDSGASTLWNKFFNRKVSGNKSSIDKKEEGKIGNSPESVYEQCQEQIDAREFKHVMVNIYDVGDDDGNGTDLSFGALILFKFDKKDFIKIPDDDDLMTGRWNKKESVTLGDDIRKLFNDFIDLDDEISIGIDNKTVNFGISINDSLEGYYRETTAENFEQWLDWADRDIEKDQGKHWLALRNLLIKKGCLEDNLQWGELNYFEYDDTDGQVTSDVLLIGDLEGVHTINVNAKTDKWISGNLEFPYHSSIPSNARTIFPKFKFFDEDSIRLTCEEAKVNAPNGIITQPIGVYIQISFFTAPDQYKLYYPSIKHLDRYWNQYYKRAVKWWATIKPMLTGDGAKAGGFAGKNTLPQIIRPAKGFQTQLELPFKDWLIISELPMIKS